MTGLTVRPLLPDLLQFYAPACEDGQGASDCPPRVRRSPRARRAVSLPQSVRAARPVLLCGTCRANRKPNNRRAVESGPCSLATAYVSSGSATADRVGRNATTLARTSACRTNLVKPPLHTWRATRGTRFFNAPRRNNGDSLQHLPAAVCRPGRTLLMTHAGRRYSFRKSGDAPWEVWSRIGSLLGLGDVVEQRLGDAVLKASEFRTCSDILAAPL